MDEFKLQGRTIYKAPHETKHDDGSASFTLGFPVCEVSEWLQDPEQVLGMLNSYDELRTQLAERDKTIERLKEGLTEIMFGGLDCPAAMCGSEASFYRSRAYDFVGIAARTLEACTMIEENADDTNA